MRAIAPLVLALLPAMSTASGIERASPFDYYVLALSWSPTWCALTGDARGADQCDPHHDFSFILHGLWPQYETGWPSDCATDQSDPTRRQTSDMADIMGSGGLAWHEWKKHGRCSGLASGTYFKLARRAYETLAIPDVLRHLDRDVTIPPAIVEQAFTEANPGLTPDMITVTCEAGRIDEVRICLTPDLEFRTCGADVARDCPLKNAIMDAVR